MKSATNYNLVKEALTLYELRRYDLALKKYTELLENSQYSSFKDIAYWGIGNSLVSLGKTKEGMAALEKGYALYPTSGILAKSLSLHYSNQERYAKTREIATQWLKHIPNDADAHLVMARALMRGNMKDSKEVFPHLETAKRLDPSEPDVYELLGEAHWKLKNDAETARTYYQEALRFNPHDEYLYNNYGVFLLQTGDPHGALEAFKTALRIDPSMHLSAENLELAFAETHPVINWTYKLSNTLTKIPVLGKLSAIKFYFIAIILMLLSRETGYIGILMLLLFMFWGLLTYLKIIARIFIVWAFRKGWIS